MGDRSKVEYSPVQDIVGFMSLVTDSFAQRSQRRLSNFRQCVHCSQVGVNDLKILKWYKCPGLKFIFSFHLEIKNKYKEEN